MNIATALTLGDMTVLADARRGPPDRGQHRQAAGAAKARYMPGGK
jgi:hypothetical protein